jgi:hypothetical protein
MIGVIAGVALGACAEPAPHVARSIPLASTSAGAKVTRSAMEPDLRALNLDPKRLPPFDALSPRQLRGIMSTFTRSLGFACIDCHGANGARVDAKTRAVTAGMWDQMTRRFSFDDGSPVYCDSCHHGQPTFLDRRDRGALGAWMSENFTGPLRRASAKNTDVECETCHGETFEPQILARWR